MTDKPAHGSPCNRCGICCQETLCVVGIFVFGRTVGPCPAIEDGPTCGMVSNPKRYAPLLVARSGKKEVSDAAKLMTAVGFGCDFSLAGEKRDHNFSRKMREFQAANKPMFVRAQRILGIG